MLLCVRKHLQRGQSYVNTSSNQGHTSNRGRPRFLGAQDDENNMKNTI